MAKIISFEGCVGAGKTSLANYFSHELRAPKMLEEYEGNPFLREFYQTKSNIGSRNTVNLETEITFLLIHYNQLKKVVRDYQEDKDLVIADFSIEKDLVYAELNLNKDELRVFRNIYDYVIGRVGIPLAVLYIDLSLKMLKRRIFQRGRPYEMSANPEYFKKYNDKVKEYFRNEAQSKIYLFNVDDLDFDPDNKKLCQIRNTILEIVSYKRQLRSYENNSCSHPSDA